LTFSGLILASEPGLIASFQEGTVISMMLAHFLMLFSRHGGSLSSPTAAGAPSCAWGSASAALARGKGRGRVASRRLALGSLVRAKTKIEAERVGKYMLRPALALERLTFLEPEGKVGYRWGLIWNLSPG